MSGKKEWHNRCGYCPLPEYDTFYIVEDNIGGCNDWDSWVKIHTGRFSSKEDAEKVASQYKELYPEARLSISPTYEQSAESRKKVVIV